VRLPGISVSPFSAPLLVFRQANMLLWQNPLMSAIALSVTDMLPWGAVQDRENEPDALMSDPSQVESFDLEGESGGSLRAFYHLNAQACHVLAARGARVLDLGCGSARYLIYLARCRPDLTFVGIDGSQSMLKAGRALISSAGLADRIELVQGDMADPVAVAGDDFDLSICLFALHHLPDQRAVLSTICGMQEACAKRNGSLWIFDVQRPRRMVTAERFPRWLSPQAGRLFNRDATYSLRAAWSGDEMRKMVSKATIRQAVHVSAQLIELFQCAWIRGANYLSPADSMKPEYDDAQTTTVAAQLRGLFPRWPQ